MINPINKYRAIYPSLGGYIICYNIVENEFPWEASLSSLIDLCDEVVILECHSTDDTEKVLLTRYGNNPKVRIIKAKESWNFDNPCIVGERKQEARSHLTTSYCVQLDLDEVIHEKDIQPIRNLMIDYPQIDVFDFGYITFYGSLYKIGIFPGAENCWRWRLTKNLPNLIHGVHGAARRFDIEGRTFPDKQMSDCCEYINADTLEIWPNALFIPKELTDVYNNAIKNPTDKIIAEKCGLGMSRMAAETICIYHLGWLNFNRKAKNATQFWIKSHSYRHGRTEHSGLFNGIENNPEAIIKQWLDKPTAKINIVSLPKYISEDYFKHNNMVKKSKIYNLSLNRFDNAGVPAWGRQLENLLNKQYDLHWYAYTDYLQQNNLIENDLAKLLNEWLITHDRVKDASLIFADGFWGSYFDDNTPVVSVIHGLWSHPSRDKWGEDGISGVRRMLFNAQMSYWKNTKHKLICVSPFIHKILKDEFNIQSQLIPNCIDINQYKKITIGLGTNIENLVKQKPIIVHAITSTNKGSDILPIMQAQLSKDFDIYKLDDLMQKFNIPKNLAFGIADVVLMPSKWEANSMFLLEALASDKPIVTFNTGLMATHTNDWPRVGKVVTDYQPEMFINGVHEVYENRDKYDGRKFLIDNKYTQDRWNKDIMELIKNYV